MVLKGVTDVFAQEVPMVKYDRRLRALALSLLGGAGAGCHNTTLCEPASSTLGLIVTSGVSETYLAQVDKMGADVPHLACKAETTLVTARAVLRESEDGNCQSTGKSCLGGSALDRRLMPLRITLPSSNSVESTSHIQMLQGEFRVVGVGKGVSIEDCSRTALRACNVGVDAYYDQQRGPRPPTLGCRMADYQNRCEPGERQPRDELAAT